MSLSSRVRSSTVGLLPLVLLAIAPQARAVSASAGFDWSALQVSVRDTAPDDGVVAGISWLHDDRSSAYRCTTHGPCDTLGSWIDGTTTADIPVSGPSFAAQVAWSATALQASITGRAADEDVLLFVDRWNTFRFDGAGEVTLTLPYTLALDATGTDAANGSFALASLWTDGGASASWHVSSPWDGTSTHSGLLSVTLAGDNGATRIFSATVNAVLDNSPVLPPPVAAPVPEPTTLAMLLGGVGLVAGATRRRAAAVDKAVDGAGVPRG